ncbi:hypothetical protein CW304_18655 [Bacillus sp. UFRGS-B20]|nr:hypothetical protein CW304_18655 [Bacillus sp. UFRGS-B20]
MGETILALNNLMVAKIKFWNRSIIVDEIWKKYSWGYTILFSFSTPVKEPLTDEGFQNQNTSSFSLTCAVGDFESSISFY